MKLKLIFLLSLFLVNQQSYINGMINIVEQQPDDQEVFNPFNDTWQHDDEIINAWQADDNLSNILKAKGLWSKNTNPNKQEYVRTLLRYQSNNAPDVDINDLTKCLLFVIVHGTGFGGQSGNNNPNYYDTSKDEFRGFLRFAQNYLERYNKKRIWKSDKKFLHLFSYKWSGDLFDFKRRPEGEIVADYVNLYYPYSQIIFIGHSHGNNVINFASHKLNPLEGDSPTDKPRIRRLIYFAPPCRQEIPQEEKSSIFNPLAKAYDAVNNYMAVKPINYKKLFTFYSKMHGIPLPFCSTGDKVVPLGSIDAGTGTIALVSITGGSVATYFCTKSENEKVKEYGTKIAGTLTVYSGVAAIQALSKKNNNAYYYKNIELNKETGINVCIETFVNRERIGHSNDTLLQYFGNALENLEKYYPVCVAGGGHFILNIDTQEQEPKLECVLKKLKNDDSVKAGFSNNNYENKSCVEKAKKQKDKADIIIKHLVERVNNQEIDGVEEDDIKERNIEKLTEMQLENIKNGIAGEYRKHISIEKLRRISYYSCKKPFEAEIFASKDNKLFFKLNDIEEEQSI